MKTALVAGSTGLIGHELVNLLIQDNRYEKVKALTRKALSIQHPKLEVVIVDFDRLHAYEDELVADDVFCCLGTTMKQAKTKEAFKKVDYDYPVSLANITKTKGACQYLLVSALGADGHSGIYYNRVKGEVEQALAAVGFQTLHVLRPSLLLGHRSESRSGEDAAKIFYKIFGAFIPKKYKGIQATSVARAMLAFARQEKQGAYVHESVELQSY